MNKEKFILIKKIEDEELEKAKKVIEELNRSNKILQKVNKKCESRN